MEVWLALAWSKTTIHPQIEVEPERGRSCAFLIEYSAFLTSQFDHSVTKTPSLHLLHHTKVPPDEAQRHLGRY